MQEVTDLINKNEIIKQIPLFSELNWIESKIILPKMSFFEYKKNEIVYKEGDPPDAFYLLLSGRLEVSTKLASGEEKVLEFLTRSKYFGIISLFTGEPHSVNVRAINDSLILKINKDNFDYIMNHIPKLAVHMNKSLSRRLIRKRLHPQDIFETKIISVCSAMAAVGRSIYATNLSLSLKRETSKEVILVSVSSDGNTISQRLGLETKIIPLDLGEISFDETKIKEGIITHASNISLLSIIYNPEGQSEQTDIIHLLSVLMKDYHFIIIDLPEGLNNIVYATVKQSDLIHVVTDEWRHNLVSTREFIESLRNYAKEIEENLFVIINETESKDTRISAGEKKKLLKEKIHVIIPTFKGPQVDKGYFTAVLDYPDVEYSRAVRNIARLIGEVSVGLALSGGAAFGLSDIGVIKVLEEEGITVDAVAGSSMGALMGALWVSGIRAADLEKIALGFRNKLKVLELFDFVFPRRGLTAGKQITRFLEKYLKDKTFQDLKVAFRVTACDLETRQEIIFDEGSLVRAVRASVSIPGVFSPLFDNGRFLIDGGVIQPLPVQVLIRMGVSKIIAVNTLPSRLDLEKSSQKYKELEEKERLRIQKSNLFKKFFYWLRIKIRKMFFPNILDAIVVSMQATESVLAELSCKQSEVCLHPDLSGINWFEFYKSDELIKRGEEETRRFLAKIKALIKK